MVGVIFAGRIMGLRFNFLRRKEIGVILSEAGPASFFTGVIIEGVG